MGAPDDFQAAKRPNENGSIVRIRIDGSVSVFSRKGSYFTLAMMTEGCMAVLVSSQQDTWSVGGFMLALHRLYKCTAILMAFVMISIVPASAQTSTPESAPESAFGVDPNAACGMSRLRVGDLKDIDNTIEPGVERATEEAHDWQGDARLYTLRLGCPLLVTGVKWEGVYFSQAAQAFYETDTGKVDPVEVDPTLIPTLDPDQFQMSMVYESLIDYGFTDDLLLTAQGGVTLKTSTNELPFGPPDAPRGHVYAHMSIEEQDVIVDVWVSMSDGVVHTYRPQ